MARTRPVNVRTSWRNAVSAERFPAGMCPVKATLLALPMTPDGRMVIARDELVELVGLPDRTLNRHLARAVAAGWLVRDVRGGNGRPSVYTAAIPDVLSAINGPLLSELSAIHSYPTPGSCLPRGGALNKDNSASVSEHVALGREAPREPTTLFAVPEPTSNGKSAPKDGFAEWYAIYPRHEAKAKAATAYAKALKSGVTPAALLEGARRYRDDPNRDAGYTKLPTTWLNGGCWDDDPLPARRTDAPRTSGPLAMNLTAEHYPEDLSDPAWSL